MTVARAKIGIRFDFCPLDEATAREVLDWRYAPPYDVSDADPGRLESDLRTMLDPERAARIEVQIGLRIGDESFLVRIAGGRIEIAAGPVDRADTVLTGTATAIAAAIYGGRNIGNGGATLRSGGGRLEVTIPANGFVLLVKQ